MSATDSSIASATALAVQSPAPRIVHLFIDGDDQFVMTDELEMAVKDTPYNPDPAHSWYTMNGDIAKRMAEQCEHLIEFIPTPIYRGAQLSTVLTPTGIEVILATDALLDAIAFLVFNLGVFQTRNPEHWQAIKITQFYRTLEIVFDVKSTSKFFIPVDILNGLNQLARDEFDGFPEAKPVTGNLLVEQLIELGILTNQVEIPLYDTFMFCDFKKNIDIMACALSCVVEKSPQFSKFFHGQKACKHLMVCSICVENEKNLRVVDDKQKVGILLKVLELTAGSEQVEASKKIQKNKKRSANSLSAETVNCKRSRKTSAVEEVPIDFEQMLEDLHDRQSQLNQENPLDAAGKEIRKLKALIEDLAIHEFADMELERFEEQFLIYSSALEQNVAAIQTDNLPAIISIPAYPILSDEFKKAVELAQEQRNKQLERECVICSDEMDLEKKEELFACPVCGKSVHLECIETWFNTTRNCVHCRAKC